MVKVENTNLIVIAGVVILVIIGVFIFTRGSASKASSISNTTNAVSKNAISTPPANTVVLATNVTNSTKGSNTLAPYMNSSSITAGQMDDVLGTGWHAYRQVFTGRRIVDGIYNGQVYINGTESEYLANAKGYLFVEWVAYPNSTYASEYFIVRLESSLPPPHGIYGRVLGNARYVYANVTTATYTGDVMLAQDGPYVIEMMLHNETFNLTQAREVLVYQVSQMNV